MCSYGPLYIRLPIRFFSGVVSCPIPIGAIFFKLTYPPPLEGNAYVIIHFAHGVAFGNLNKQGDLTKLF